MIKQEVLRTQIPRSPVGDQQECVTPVEGLQETLAVSPRGRL